MYNFSPYRLGSSISNAKHQNSQAQKTQVNHKEKDTLLSSLSLLKTIYFAVEVIQRRNYKLSATQIAT